MLTRYFIPLTLVLAALALGVFFFSGHSSKTRDVRASVPVERFTLSNGLTVVVMPNDRIPLVSHLLVVKAGSADDPQGKSGLAHYLEHLMFTGTKNFPEGTYDRSVNRVGGAQNASTSSDRTMYYATVPKDQLPMVMTMEADRLANLSFDTERAARELKIITEERNMRVDSSAASQWREQMDAITFLNHPYHQPVIGWAEDMATFTAEDARAFFERYYRPSNMVLIVAGDVTGRDVRRFAQRYYGGLMAAAAPSRNWPKEPPVRMARRGEMRDARVNEPRLLRQYVAPSVKEGVSTNALPLEVFAQYLGGGDSSVLYNALVREQKLATGVSVNYDAMMIGPGMLRISAIPAQGVTLQQLEEALDRELTRVLSSPLDVAAILRAKTLLIAETTFAQDGMQQMADMMAELYAVGLDEHYFYDWSKNIEAVTPDVALAAAQAVIVPKGAVTGYLLPDVKSVPIAAPAAAAIPPAPVPMPEVSDVR
ncbi:MAG: M16 family metallopeptidase [Rickettsiales bacterium]